MGAKALNTRDAMEFMKVCRDLTETHGGFSTSDLYGLRGYNAFVPAAKHLGYVIYHGMKFHWVNDSLTQVMAECLVREHILTLERRRKVRSLAKREATLRNQPDLDTNVINLEQHRPRKQFTKSRPIVFLINRPWWKRLFLGYPLHENLEIIHANTLINHAREVENGEKLDRLLAEWSGTDAESET